MSTNIEGKVVVITGASSGLGESTARHLAELGATVVLGARRKDRLDAIVKDITAKGGKALAVTVDVTKREQVDALIQAALKAYGKVDVLVNNAGIMPIATFAALKVDEWEKMIDINIKGVLYGIAAALPHMKQQKSGHIINVSSVAGHKITPLGGRVLRDQARRARLVRRATRGSEALQHPTTVISPGAVATELPDAITEPEVAANMRKFYDAFAIPADSFARAVAFAMSQPDEVDVNEILFRPTRQEL
jgi:NADP-dependent 3-hydroxy acid dehydrogenase YdfG